jgi:hypothetical protein
MSAIWLKIHPVVRAFIGTICLSSAGMSLMLFGPPSAVGQGPDPQVRKIFADWKHRQARTKSVLCRIQGEEVLPKGTMTDDKHRYLPDAPPRDIHMPVKRFFLLDFATNRYRMQIEGANYHRQSKKVYPYFQDRIFDGKVIKNYQPKEKNTYPNQWGPKGVELGVGDGWLGGAPIAVDEWGIFYGFGSVPCRQYPLLPGKLQVLPSMARVYLHGRGAHQGRACLVLRTRVHDQGFEEWWVDTARDSAVLRYVWYLTGKPTYDLDVVYQRTPHGWLTSSWTFTHRDNHGGQILDVRRFRVVELKLDPPVSDKDFQIEVPPGTLVAYYHHQPPPPGEVLEKEEPKLELYRVKEGGDLQQVIIENGIERPVSSFAWWWLAVPALGLGAGLAWFFLRRRKRFQQGNVC